MDQANYMPCFRDWIEKFYKAKLDNEDILIENHDQKYTHSDVARVTYIGNRFVRLETVDYKLPYTLNYAELVASKSKTTRLVFKNSVKKD